MAKRRNAERRPQPPAAAPEPQLPWLTHRFAAPLLFAAWLLLGLAYVLFGRYIGDEGWYCLASREVWDGRSLYFDVPFTQMPLLPYVYGLFLQVLPARIESGRILSFLFTTSGVWAIWKLCRERYGALAANAVLLFVVVNRTFAFDCTNVKTQALGFALSAWSLLFFSKVSIADKKNVAWGLAAGIFAGLALAERLSLLPLAALLPFGVFLASRKPAAAIAAAMGAWLLPIAIAGWFELKSHESFVFGVYGFHNEFFEKKPLTTRLWAYWGGVIRNYPALIISTLAAIALLVRHRQKDRVFEIFVMLSWALIALLQCTRKTTYPVYQTTITWGSLIAFGYLLQPGNLPRLLSARKIVIAGLALTAAFMPWAEGWLETNPLRNGSGVYRLGRKLASLPGENLFTLDAGLAFTAPEKQLLPGYEMSEFSVYWNAHKLQDEQRAGARKSIRKLLHDLEHIADIAALREMDVKLLKPEIADLLLSIWKNKYVTVEKADYGQFGDTVMLGKRKGQ